MRDPVMDNEGVTYERDAIVEWLKRSPVSPVTRKPLSVGDLRACPSTAFYRPIMLKRVPGPNRALKDSIEAMRGKVEPTQARHIAPQAPPIKTHSGAPVAPLAQQTPQSDVKGSYYAPLFHYDG